MSAPSPPDAFAIFTGLRERLFREYLATSGPAPESGAGGGPEVVGVAMEFAVPSAVCLVFGLRDGSASMYLSSGGGFIGGHGRPEINAAAKRLVETARPFAASFPRVHEYPLPTAGQVRFSLLTTDGVRAAVADESELRSRRGELFRLYVGAHEILTGFRLMHEGKDGEQPKEPTYVNCLLVALARGSISSVTLTKGTPPPDPARLTADETDLKWFAEIGFDFAHLPTAKIISYVLQMAGFGRFTLWKREGIITTKLAAHGGQSFTDVRFRVRKLGRAAIEISRLDRRDEAASR